MIAKIVWLSLLSLALGAEASSEHSTSLKDQEFTDQRYRSSRSIWPFTSFGSDADETTTTDPPSEAGANFFLNGETALPQSLDLTKYPVWKIHKYQGIDLKPIKLQPENAYPPSAALSASRFDSSVPDSQKSYENLYESFVNSKNGRTDATGQEGPYPPANPDTVQAKESSGVYPPEQTGYPEEVRQTYQSGESQSSDYWNSDGRNAQKPYMTYALPAETYGPPRIPHETYGPPPLPHVTYGPPPVPHMIYGPPPVPHATYGVPETKGQTFQGATASVPQANSPNNPDLSLLNDLGGLADFLPEPQGTTEASPSGFFANMLSRIRGWTKPSVPDETSTESGQTGGLLSSLFGQQQQTDESQTSGSSSLIGSALSSLFNRNRDEKPATVLSPTVYLPEPRGPYVAIRVPPGTENQFSNLAIDVSTIPLQDAPPIPFKQDDIPPISAPTSYSDYNYNFGPAEVRNNGRHEILAISDDQGQGNGQQFVPSSVETAQGVQLDSATKTQQTNYQQDNTISEKYQIQPINEYQMPHTHFESNNYKTGSSINVVPNTEYSYGDAAVPLQSAAYELHIRAENDHQALYNSQQSNHKQVTLVNNQDFNPPLIHGDSAAMINNHRFNDQVNQQSTIQQQVGLLDYQLPTADNTFGPISPGYQISLSDHQTPRNPAKPVVQHDNVPIQEPVDFQKGIFYQDTNNQATSSKQDFSSLTSYGTPTISYEAEPFVASPSDTSEVIVEVSSNVRMANDSLSFDQQNENNDNNNDEDDNWKAGAKVGEEPSVKKNLQDQQGWRRSEPERQAPTEVQGSSIFRTETDSIPNARENRHFEDAKVTLGYSKVQQNVAAVQ